jgi:hypothetical protein
MLGDTEIQPPSSPEPTPTWEPVAPEPVVPPAPTYVPAKPRSSPLPILFGFLIVIVVAVGIGIAYYKTKLTASMTPSPSPSVMAYPSISPSPNATASATPKGSVKPSVKPSAVVVASATPKPPAAPTLDIRFGNPSANVKQTIDEGKGDGRVINREYTSIQVGEFDEVSSSWSPRVTVCFHIVSNEEIKGKDLKFSFSLDDKIEVEDNFGQYDKMEAGKIYDWCHDVTTSIGSHTAKLLINPDKSVKELTYVNDLARLEWKNLADKIAPNITFGGPFDWDDKGTCFLVYAPSDNVSKLSEIKVEQKVDNGNWSPIVDATYCHKGTSGESHTYTVHAIDARGNTSEQKSTFVLY